jgi:hypothetical protein
MSSTLFLRVASVLTLIHCAGHTIGGVFGKPKNGAEEIAVIETMKAHQFNVMGSMRAYWDFFFGYGLVLTVTLLIQGVLFWQLGSLIKTNAAAANPVVALFCVNFLLMSVIVFKYFFLGAGVLELLIAACLAAAFFTAASV